MSESTPLASTLPIVLDSNCLWANFELHGRNFAQLIRFQKAKLIQIYIPTVVVKELARQERQRIEASATQLANWAGKAPAVRHMHALGLTEDGLSRRARMRKKLGATPSIEFLEKEFTDRLDSLDIARLDIPSLLPDDLLADYAYSHKPFKSNGTGLADWLIWKSVISFFSASQTVYFITNNTSDFFEGEALDPILASQAENGVKIIAIKSIKEFIDSPPHPIEISFRSGADSTDISAEEISGYEEDFGILQSYETKARETTIAGAANLEGEEVPLTYGSWPYSSKDSFYVDSVTIEEDSFEWDPIETFDYDEQAGTGSVDATLGLRISVPIEEVSGFYVSFPEFAAEEANSDSIEMVGSIHVKFTADMRTGYDSAEIFSWEIERL